MKIKEKKEEIPEVRKRVTDVKVPSSVAKMFKRNTATFFFQRIILRQFSQFEFEIIIKYNKLRLRLMVKEKFINI